LLTLLHFSRNFFCKIYLTIYGLLKGNGELMINIKRLLIGRPLTNEALNEERFGILWGLPILASDAISSVAYAGQEILTALVPIIGLAAYGQLTILSAAIIGLLVLLTFSYRQTIDAYPNGGGAYIVAKDNLGVIAGVTAGAALSVDYIMTVAVSISSGADAITTVFPSMEHFKVEFCVLVVILLMTGNLRGIRESSKMFSIPAYAFMIALLAMIFLGFFQAATGNLHKIQHTQEVLKTTAPLTIFLLLKAFSNGCSALTGVEAVSNAVPNFKEPSTKHAKRVLLLLSLIVLGLFGGSSILANLIQVEPAANKMVLVQLAGQVFGAGSFMYYFLMASTFVILAMAANTAYSGFPLLVSVMAKDGYVPRQLSMRGDRLSYSNGIIVLSSIAALLIVVFQANVTALIGLYAIGVFISFTLSQSGMFMRWLRNKAPHWHVKAAVNGIGAVVTAIVVVIISITKFHEGAYIVVILIPILVFTMLKVKEHYIAVAKQLRIKPEEFPEIDITNDHYRNRVIVPIESINKSSIRALRYAKTISDRVFAFTVAIDEESAEKITAKWNLLNTDIQLIVKYSPFRKVVEPLLEFIQSEEYNYQKGDMITVILAQFTLKHWWHKIMHHQTRVYIERELLKHKHIVVSTIPLQLKDDNFVIKSPKYK
jgi:amino acid transporter